MFICFIRSFIESVARRIAVLTNDRETTKVITELERLTLSQLIQFFHTCRDKYMHSKIEPGIYKVN